jgi:hypothetical protein
MWTSFWHLCRDAWPAMVAATSNNTPGFLLWTVAFTITVWFATVLSSYSKRRRIEKAGAFAFAFKDSARDGIYIVAGMAVLTFCAWAAFIPAVAYRKYQALAFQNAVLVGKGNGNPYAIKADNEYASMMNTLMAFESLKGEIGAPEGWVRRKGDSSKRKQGDRHSIDWLR